jgi:flagellar protein FlaG
MAQFSIAPLQSGAVAAAAAGAGTAQATALPDATPQSSTKEALAYNRAVSAAVQTLNDAGYAGAGREVTISLDQATRRPVVKVVDTATNEVIQQWPTQYVLQLAADSQKAGRDSG